MASDVSAEHINSCNIGRLNPCDINICVTNVVGIPNTSNSPTDFWILAFNHSTFYSSKDKRIVISKAVMKISVSYISALKPQLNPEYASIRNPFTPIILDIYAIEYEAKVYEN